MAGHRKVDELSKIGTRVTPQSEQADPRQVPNSAGGFTFKINWEERVRRFLILGSDGGTYYTSARELTKNNAEIILRAMATDARKVTDILVEISEAGRAPKQNPTLFTYAVVVSLADLEGRRYALAQFGRIIRTGTHLLIFARYVEQFRGWGRGLRLAVSDWYLSKPVDQLAYQMVKYRQREGWSQADVLRSAHPNTSAPKDAPGPYDYLFRWALGRSDVDLDQLPVKVQAFEAAQKGNLEDWLEGARTGLSWEMLPDAALGERQVWEILLDQGIPMTALFRQLPRLTRLGIAHDRRADIAKQLTDQARLKNARVHPVNVLIAMRTYASGHGARGGGTWTPEWMIINAMDEAFYASFGFVEPSGKRILLALDVSGSMTRPISNLPISCREAAAAIAMTIARVEPDHDIVGFTSSGGYSYWGRGSGDQAKAVSELTISPRQRLDDVVNYTAHLGFGGTDCAAPMLWALQNNRKYDAFVILTDNETWAGKIHPHQALEQYRNKTKIDAKLVVVGMTSTGFSIADPDDLGSLDVVGFDSAVPQLITDFIRGI